MTSQIAEMAYGYKIRTFDHPYMNLSEEAMKCIAAAVGAGFYLVDIFPLRTSYYTIFDVISHSSTQYQSNTFPPGFQVLYFSVKPPCGGDQSSHWRRSLSQNTSNARYACHRLCANCILTMWFLKAQGDTFDCIAARLLQVLPKDDTTITEEDVKEVLPSIYAGTSNPNSHERDHR